jgi:hypothetical protein
VSVTIVPALTLRLYQLVCPTTSNPGAVVPTETDVWFPVAETVTVLPDKPAYDTEPELVPANSALVDACFDPDNVDVQQLFNNFIPAGDTDPIYDTSANVSSLIQAKNELIPVRYRLRCILVALKADYSTKPQVSEASFTLRLPLLAQSYQYKFSPLLGQFTCAGLAVELYRVLVASAGQYILAGNPTEFEFNPPIPPPFGFTPGNYVFKPEPKSIFIGQFDNDFSDSSGYNTYVAPLSFGSAPVISSAQAKFGGASLLTQVSPDDFFTSTGLQFYLDPDVAPSFTDDFLLEAWIYPLSLTVNESVLWSVDFSIEGQSGVSNLLMFTAPIGGGNTRRLSLLTAIGSTIQFNNVVLQHPEDTEIGAWTHVALQRRDGRCTLYVNGVPSSTTARSKLSLKNRNMLGNFTSEPSASGNRQFAGYIDAVRIADGSPRPLEGFTVPTKAPDKLDFDSAILSSSRNYGVATGDYVLTGQDVDLVGITLFTELFGGDFEFEGVSAEFARPSRSIVTQTGAYTLAGVRTILAPLAVSSTGNSAGANSNINAGWNLSGLAVGDVALLAIETDSNGSTPLLPSNWRLLSDTPVNTNTGTAGTRLQLYWSRVTVVPPPAVFISGSDNHTLIMISAWRGAKAEGVPFGVYNQGFFDTEQSTHTVPGITTSSESSLVLVICTSSDGGTFGTPWVSFPVNPRLKVSGRFITGTTLGSGGGIQIFYGRSTAPVDIGDTTVFVTATRPAQLTYYVVELLADV